MSVRIRGAAATPAGLRESAVVTVSDDGSILSIESGTGPVDYDAGDLWIVPGFVDIHVHGAGGSDFMDGDVDSVRNIVRTHARYGTTTLLATTLTSASDQIDRCIDTVRTVMAQPGDDEARIAGLHLEGPYISAAKRGAQPAGPIRPPDWDEMSQWIARSGGAIRVMTLAPEIEGALDFIRRATAAGVVISVGHTSADYEQTLAALDAGASHGTHLFNAMPPLGHRSPGPVGALLTDPRAFVELIVDGIHLHPATVAMAVRSKGAANVILITDAISGAAMPNGDYKLAGSTATVRDGVVAFADGTLAGSALTMNRAFANALAWTFVGPSEIAAMSSANAAGRIGLADRIGRIEPGFQADLAVIDPQSGDVAATMREGKWMWKA